MLVCGVNGDFEFSSRNVHTSVPGLQIKSVCALADVTIQKIYFKPKLQYLPFTMGQIINPFAIVRDPVIMGRK